MTKKERTHLRPAARALALEPRLLFDGAGAVAAADHFDMANDHSAEAQKQETQPAADAPPSALAEKPAAALPLLELAENAGDYQALLGEAASLAQQKLVDWLNSDDFRAQAAEIFNADAGSADWNAQLDALRSEILNGSYGIRTEVRSNEELMQVLGAWTASGTTGERTIYLNAEWLAKSDAATVATVLLEELGHDIDNRLNNGKDSAGDEGHAFASLLTTGDANLAVNLGRDDHRTLLLDGLQVQVENAGPYSIAQVHFVSMPENQIYSGLVNVNTASGASQVIETIIAITATSNKTVIVYDHWEDGYESDINSPTQTATTKVWTYTDADGWFVDTDGNFIKDAGESAVANGTSIVANGRTLILNNNVATSHATSPGSNVFFDGRDKIGSTKAVTVTRAGWDTGITTVLGGAVNLVDVGNAGTNFVIPVGADTYYSGSNSLYTKTSLYVMAYEDNTVVTITLANADGTLSSNTITRTLAQGESLYVQGGGAFSAGTGLNDARATVYDGTTVSASKAIGVNVLAGTSTTQNRWHSISSVDSWGSSYYAPVATVGGAISDVYFYNNNSTAITIEYETASGTSSVTVAAHSGGAFAMPASAAHFYTSDGSKFYAVASVDRSTSRDWSYTLVAEKTLTDRFVTAWAPGNSQNDGTIQSSGYNGSPIWVTSTADTLLYVDGYVKLYGTTGAGSTAASGGSATPGGNAIAIDKIIAKNGDEITGTAAINAFIASSSGDIATMVFSVSRLQSYRIYDASSAKNQSGLAVYTKDGTLLTAAWGQDATASGTTAPYLDMGTTVSPQPDYLITKGALEKASGGDSTISNDNLLVELGETVVYTITIENRAVIDLFNINIKDAMGSPDSGTYVANSATLHIYDADGNELYAIPDFDGASDLFPLLDGGYTLTGDLDNVKPGTQGLQIGSRIVVKYAVQIRSDIDSTLADDNYMISNSVTMSGQPPVGDPIDPKEVTIKTKVSAIDAPPQTVAEDATLASSTFKVTNTEGLSSLVIGGTTFTLAQLNTATPASPLTVNTTEGVLTITGYSNDATNKVGTVTYTYDPAGTSKDHSGGAEVKDTVAVKANYAGGKEVSGNLVIDITDTVPDAQDDARTLERDDDVVNGNVMAGGGSGDVADTLGGDTTRLHRIGTGSSATETVANSTTSANGTSVTGTHGTLIIGADGSYTYDLDETTNAVADLKPGQTLTETFTYELIDSDGNTSTAILTITIQNTGVHVNSITVNEGSPYGVFEVTGTPADTVTLTLMNGSAQGGTDGSDTSGSTDYIDNSLEYFDGTQWVAYTGAAVTVPAGGVLLVRVPIVNDDNYENSETFQLKATNTGGKTATGTGTIKDDGTGTVWLPKDPLNPGVPGDPTDPTLELVPLNPGDPTDPLDPGYPGVTPPPGAFDDDRTVDVNDITVNEGSPYGVFEVTGQPGQKVTLELIDGSATGGTGSPTDGTVDYHTTLEYFDGTQWQTYTPGDLVDVPAGGTLLIRVPIVNDDNYENSETFQLKATNTGGKTATGTGTIKDDGTGTVWLPKDPLNPGVPGDPADPTLELVPLNPGDPTDPLDPGYPGVTPPPGAFDDDRTVDINDITVNEGSPYGVFEVTGQPGQKVTLELIDGSATGGTGSPTDGTVDYHTTLEYFDGTQWQTYTPGDLVDVPAGGTLLIRVPIVNDDNYENSETFQLKATNTGGKTATGTGTIKDDGTGTVWVPEDPANPGQPGEPVTPGGPLPPPTRPLVPVDPTDPPTPGVTPPTFDDDRTVDVNDITVNEGSPYGVFEVTGQPGQKVTLELIDGSATGGGVDYGPGMETSTDGGNTWTPYTPGDEITVGGSGKVLVRTPIVNDGIYEGSETFTLTARVVGGKNTATGTATIKDDGTGDIQDPNTGDPLDPSPPKDDDRTPPPQQLQPDPDLYKPLVPPALQPNNPLNNSPVMLDAGPYFAGERFNDVRRMVLPFHPVVYVNREVSASQELRIQDDPRGFSDPAAVSPGQQQPASLGRDLGQDPNLFVTHAIRDSQREAGFQHNTVEGRYSRLGLGSDGYLSQPGLFSNPATELDELLKEQRKKLKKAAEMDEEPTERGANGEKTAQPAERPTGKSADAAGTPQRLAGGAAPSFGEQLRSGAARLPMAPRKA